MSEPAADYSGFDRTPANKREAILLAAGQVFLQSGYGAASMDAIAKTAGVSKATVYAHFTSKDRLFAAMIDYGCRERFGSLREARSDSEDVAAELLDIGRNFYRLVLDPQGLAIYRVVIAESARFPELGRAFYDAGPRLTFDLLVRILGAAVARGQLEIRELRPAAEQFIGMIRGDLYLRRLLGMAGEPEAEEIERGVVRAVDAFMRAYAPRPIP